MNCSEMEKLLDLYVDGELEPGRRAEVRAHVDGCADCRAGLEERRELARAVEQLPRELAPTRDLLPGIRRATVQRRRPLWFWAGMAASLVALSTVAWVTLRAPEKTETAGRITVPDLPQPWSVARVNQLEFEMAEEEYELAAERLLQLLEEREDSLSPETLELVEENLRIIDQAIDEVRDALESAPEDPANGHALNALHRQKVEFLWRLSRLSS